jgi:hypothetical protein
MRKRRRATQPEEPELDAVTEEANPQSVAADGARAQGPWDSAELPVDQNDESRAHLGAISVEGHPDIELRLQVDEGSGQVSALLLVADDGAMELRAFAAPRNEDLWTDIRTQLAAEAIRRGGKAIEVDGPYGTALHMVVPAVTPDGQDVEQPSTVMGISGPRWLLRVSMFGRPAVQFRPDALLETTLRSVVVTRGTGPMAPGEPLPLVLPAGAQRLPPPP